MITLPVRCPSGQSDQLVCHGHAPNEKQKYRCRICKRQSREEPTPNVYSEARREEILRAYCRFKKALVQWKRNLLE